MSKFDKKTKGEYFFAQRDKDLQKLIDPDTGKVFSHLTYRVLCPLCGNPSFNVLFTKDGFDFVRCVGCTHVYVNPQVVEEKTIEYYNDENLQNDLLIDFISSEKQMEIRGELYTYLLNKVKDRVPSGKVLDIGCSIGQFLKMSKDRGYDVLGLELNEKAAKYGGDNFGVKIERRLLEDCSFEDNSFDIISMFGVVEHLVHPEGVMRDVYRLLKPGGIFIGICPNVQSLVCMILHEQSRTFTGRLHLSYFSEETLRYLFGKVGFINEKIEVNTCYIGKDSLINYFQFVDPFGDEVYSFLPAKFKEFILDENKSKAIEEKMNELGIGLKLRFLAQK